MDTHLEKLLSSIIESDPQGDLDDKKREAIMYAMLAMLDGEKYQAVWKFAGSISDEFTRSHLLQKLATYLSSRFEFTLAKRIADSIPIPYWRFYAVAKVASGMLEWDRKTKGSNGVLRERAFHLLREVEESLPLMTEKDGDRASIVWSAGLTLVAAGELDWAERIASRNSYCPENTEVLIRVARTRSAQGDTGRAIQILRTVAELASTGHDELTHRAFDLQDVGEIIAEMGDLAEAQRHLEASARFALESQDAHDIDGSKCLLAVALTLAKLGDFDAARVTANKITQPIRREQALQRIADCMRLPNDDLTKPD
jgi:hypothetical protein